MLDTSEERFSVIRDGIYYIFYNPYMSANRQNFTIAHELGHFMLGHHRFVKNRLLASESETNILEIHANIFARNILIPVDKTFEYMETKTFTEMSEIFEVSEKVARVRLKYLDYDNNNLNTIKRKII